MFFEIANPAPRPDEFYAARAMRWTQAARDQQVYHEAIADVASEATGFNRLKQVPAGQVG